MKAKLTAKQRRFVDEYLVDLNATQAAIRAGYSQKTAGSVGFENLRKPEIQKAVDEAKKNRAERTEITQDWVVKEMVSQYKAANQRVVKTNTEGDPVVGEDGKIVTMPIDQTNAVKVLDMLAKHTGAYEADNKRELQGGLEFSWMTGRAEDECKKS